MVGFCLDFLCFHKHLFNIYYLLGTEDSVVYALSPKKSATYYAQKEALKERPVFCLACKKLGIHHFILTASENQNKLKVNNSSYILKRSEVILFPKLERLSGKYKESQVPRAEETHELKPPWDTVLG